MPMSTASQMGLIDDLIIRPSNAPFPSYLISVLQKHLGYHNIAFFDANSLDRSPYPQSGRAPILQKEILLAVVHDVRAPTVQEDYNNYYYALDDMSFSKLSPEQQQNTMVQKTLNRFSNSDYSNYLKTRSLYHFLCLYLRDSSGRYMGRLAFSRYPDEGPFLPSEVDQLAPLAKHIAFQYEKYLNEHNSSKRLAMMEFSFSNLPIGVIYLDKNLCVEFFNDSARQFCSDLIESGIVGGSGSPLFASPTSEIQAVVDLVTNTKTLVVKGSNFSRIPAGGATYNFDLIPCVIKGINSSREMNYMLYITRQSGTSGADEKLKRKRDFTQKYGLTPREIDLIDLLEEGCTNAEIGDRLCISAHTVKAHIYSIYRKTDVSSRTALLRKLYE